MEYLDGLTNIFLNWLQGQEPEISDEILSHVFALAPGFDIVTHQTRDRIVLMRHYLQEPGLSVSNRIGKFLFIRTSIDFILSTYGDVDRLLDEMNIMKKLLEDYKAKGADTAFTQSIYDNHSVRYVAKTKFGKSWDEFSTEYLKFPVLEYIWRDAKFK
ncbi:MAG: hypothetical protein JWO03_3926 [Bacteroidetes bacterium]|nr:hypothetical protein [Bacteroidota bacterium]